MKRKLLAILLSSLMIATSFTAKVFAQDLNVGDLFVTYSDGTGVEIFDDQLYHFFLFEVTSTDPYEAKLKDVYEEETTSIMVPSSIQFDDKTITINELDANAFLNLSDLESMIIPSSIEIMGDHILDSNDALTSVFVYWTGTNQLPTLGDNLFGDNASNITLYVPHGYKTIYQNADLWKEVAAIDEFKMVNELLSTVPGGFPSSEANCWVSDYGDTIYHANGFLTTSLGLGEPTSVTDTIPLALDGNNYVSPLMNDMFVLKFVMQNNVLSKIIVEVRFFGVSEYSFSPIGNRKTIESILNTAINFPETPEDGWPNVDNGTIKLYKGDDDWLYFNDGSDDMNFLPTYVLLNPYGSNYRFTMEDGEEAIIVDFIMNNNILQSIQVVSMYEGNENVLGTYSVPITIADILATNSSFPTSDDDTPPTNAWFCETGDAAWQDAENLYLNGPIFNGDLPKTTLLIKDGNNYKYTDVSDGTELLFEMNNKGKLNKIILSFDIGVTVTLTYEPLGNRKSIAYILEHFASDFPTSANKGWINDDGGINKIYIGQPSDTTVLIFSNISGLSIPVTYLLNPSGSNYQFNYVDLVINFVISNNKLQSINVVGVPVGIEDSILGKYCPYKFTNKPISKPVGYTGNIEFVTNANYVDQSTTPVTVSVDGTPLTYNTDFEVTSGSTHVKLKGSYVSELDKGTHTIKISMDGYEDITSEFTITNPSSHSSKKYTAPNTGVE